MIDYKMEELIPVVAWLTSKYTSNESTSVSYNTAKQLMGAVMYCVEEYQNDDKAQGTLVEKEAIEVRQAYHIGYEKVVQKVGEVREKSNRLIEHFNAFGNENYYEVVAKAIPGFLTLYDPRFYPQNTIITMDYPLLGSTRTGQGVDIILEYIKGIGFEQEFLQSIPVNYITMVLDGLDPDYKNQFYNIARVVLRNFLAIGFTKKYTAMKETNYEVLNNALKTMNPQETVDVFNQLVCELVASLEVVHKEEVISYLQYEISDFVAELENGCVNDSLRQVVYMSEYGVK